MKVKTRCMERLTYGPISAPPGSSRILNLCSHASARGKVLRLAGQLLAGLDTYHLVLWDSSTGLDASTSPAVSLFPSAVPVYGIKSVSWVAQGEVRGQCLPYALLSRVRDVSVGLE
jgi:hypothetical protein